MELVLKKKIEEIEGDKRPWMYNKTGRLVKRGGRKSESAGIFNLSGNLLALELILQNIVLPCVNDRKRVD